MNKNEKGFTLMELLVVIAIIGVLAGVVLVSSQSGIGKAKRASAISTASSAMTELVTCADDGGEAINGTPAAAMAVCCVSNTCAATLTGHSATWPNINASTGWNYAATAGSLSGGDFVYSITDGTEIIDCSVAEGSCSTR